MAPVSQGLGTHYAPSRRDERAGNYRAPFLASPDHAPGRSGPRCDPAGPGVRGRTSAAVRPDHPRQLTSAVSSRATGDPLDLGAPKRRAETERLDHAFDDAPRRAANASGTARSAA